MKPTRVGVSLVELCVAMAINGIVLTALVGVLTGMRRAAGRHGERVAAAASVRVVESVLASELRAIAPAADLRAVAEDSVALRVFRGTGVVCSIAGGQPLVLYRGARNPEPVKDSVVVIRAPGAEVVVPLRAAARAPAGCGTALGEELFTMDLDSAGIGALLLVFESGSYHLTSRAFRYRLGAAGRQPLTHENFQSAAGFLSSTSAASITAFLPERTTSPLLTRHVRVTVRNAVGVPLSQDSL